MRTLPSTRVRFGTFELDLNTGEVRSAGARAPDGKVLLREQVFQVLRMLLERATSQSPITLSSGKSIANSCPSRSSCDFTTSSPPAFFMASMALRIKFMNTC